MLSSELPAQLWGQALKHANWLRNRLLASRIGGDLPILLWDSRTAVDLTKIPPFGQPGFSFIYRPKHAPRKKLLPRAEYSHFEGDNHLFRVHIPRESKTKVIRRDDFHSSNIHRLPAISSLLDGLSRQASVEASEDAENAGDAESHLFDMTSSICEANPAIAFPSKASDVPDTPRNFREAIQYPKWAAAIDREFNALVSRNTWHYVAWSPGMNVLKNKWVFKKKPIDEHHTEFLCKARCVARGDLQEAYLDFNPDSLYAPVPSHESLQMIIAFAANNNLILERGDVANA